jgi:hypothetical protein
LVRGKVVETEEIPAYCAVALAGIGDLPDTILTRSVIIRMRRRAPHEYVEPYRRRVHGDDGLLLRNRLADWSRGVVAELSRASPTMPDGIADRDADVWEPLLAIADAVGGDWPKFARVSCVSFVSDAKERTPSLGVRLLADLRVIFRDADTLATNDILEALHQLDEAPWGDLRGKPLDSRGLASRLRSFGVKPKQVRIGDWTGKGYTREDLHDASLRYLPPPPIERETSETPETRCDHCHEGGGPSDPLIRVTDGGDYVNLHRPCLDAWASRAAVSPAGNA